MLVIVFVTYCIFIQRRDPRNVAIIVDLAICKWRVHLESDFQQREHDFPMLSVWKNFIVARNSTPIKLAKV
jgi:hypothetical protein